MIRVTGTAEKERLHPEDLQGSYLLAAFRYVEENRGESGHKLRKMQTKGHGDDCRS